jgi:lon-related putative ATP-dependent protease
LHRANGGYLVLDALKVLTQLYAWEGLKRALRASEIRIESLGQVYGLVSTLSLEPEPVPLGIKVVLVGEPRLYYLLKALDPDFEELFKVAADFENEVVRDTDNVLLYAELIATLVRDAGLRPFDRTAVARVVEHSARLAGDAARLTASRRRLTDLLHEADYCAGKAGRDGVLAEDVQTALDAQTHRVDRLRSKLQEQILRDNVLIAVAGGQVGQVNGLAVIALDDFMFAHPVRITATVRIGEGTVIDIEREAELGGSIHSKGVMILSAFLGERYARDVPLSLSASLVFEQSYGPVEGDSASLAELCALMSNLADLPIAQSLAVTGSVNQFGRVQAIGAVNEKIEGFFDICKARGLTGAQGVLIPASNVKHLMLREDVVSACTEGKFRIYPVEDVDQAIELLTGVPAGQANDEGLVPEGTINYLVAAQLAELSALRQAFAMAVRQGSDNSKGGSTQAE